MADRAPARELVFCHSCENEWYRDTHGLECPACHSDVVEIIDPESDPRDDAHANEPLSQPLGPPSWTEDAPDPDEGDIDRVEWTGPNGTRFSRTTYRPLNTDTGSSRGPGGQTPFDPFGPLFSTMMGGPNFRQGPSQPPNPGSARTEGTTRFGGNFTFHTFSTGPGTTTSTFRFGNSNGNTAQDPQIPDIAGILGQMLQGLQPTPAGGGAPGSNRGDGPNQQFQNPLALLAQMLNPANARAGDAVFTQEALDRVISSLMEQHSGSTAPGPASEAAISALPKININKEHLDSNGKAECSICMEGLAIGDQVTELPCKHWFHGDCVSAWLREHDTCPQCRRGITPKEGDGDTPRATGEAPRYWQMDPSDITGQQQQNERSSQPGDSARPTSSGDGSGRPHVPVGESPPSSRSTGTRQRRDPDSGRGFSGITGWVGRHFGGNNGEGSGRQ